MTLNVAGPSLFAAHLALGSLMPVWTSSSLLRLPAGVGFPIISLLSLLVAFVDYGQLSSLLQGLI